VETKKRVLIITDEAESTGKLAGEIAAALADSSVTVLKAADFTVTELLPADLCFFGAEQPNPASFAALEKLLLHINLAGRSGGLFTAGPPKTAAYLRRIVHDSELRLSAEPFVAGKSGTVKAWLKTIT
jgi:hypothetical protein